VGRRSQEKRTGLSVEQRIQRSVKRKEKEEEMRRKEELELAKAIAESSAAPTLPTLPVPVGPVMRGLLEIQRMREQEKRKKKEETLAV